MVKSQAYVNFQDPVQAADRHGVPSLGELVAKGSLPSGRLKLQVRAGPNTEHDVEISPQGAAAAAAGAFGLRGSACSRCDLLGSLVKVWSLAYWECRQEHLAGWAVRQAEPRDAVSLGSFDELLRGLVLVAAWAVPQAGCVRMYPVSSMMYSTRTYTPQAMLRACRPDTSPQCGMHDLRALPCRGDHMAGQAVLQPERLRSCSHTILHPHPHLLQWLGGSTLPGPAAGAKLLRSCISHGRCQRCLYMTAAELAVTVLFSPAALAH